MTNFPDIEAKVLELLAKNARLQISSDQCEVELHLDSLATLEVILGLEREYEIEVDESELDLITTFKSVRSITEFVHSNAPKTSS